MAVNQGPQISRTGLVSYYDVSNEKSFRGLTATNLMYGVIAAYSAANDNTYFKTSYGTESVFIPYFNQLVNVKYVDIYNDYANGSNNCCPSPFSFHSTPIAISGNTTYMFQLIFKTDTGYYGTNYMYRYEHGASGYIKEGGLVSQDGGVPAANGRIESLGDGWYHVWGSFTSAAAATTLYTYLFHYEYATWNRIRVAGVSLTQGSAVHRPEHILNLDYRTSRGTSVALGGGLKDLVGSGVGDILNGVSYESSFGGGLSFDGTNDYVNLGADSSTSLTSTASGFSIEITFRVSATHARSNPSAIFDRYRYGVYYDYTSNYAYFVYINKTYDDTGNYSSTTTNSATLNTKGLVNHIVFTYNRSVDNATVVAYTNGIATGTVNSTRISSYPLLDAWIGNSAHLSGTYYWFEGVIYSIKVYDRAIGASEVLRNYNAIRPKTLATRNRNTILTRQLVNPKSSTSLLASTILYIDPANKQSYTPGSQFMYDLSPNRQTLTMYTNGGTTHYLTPYASIPLSTDGKGSLSFDGTNDWIRMSSNMTIATTVTVSVWVKTTASGDRGIFSHCSGGPVVLGYSVETYMKYWYYFGQWYTLTGYVAINDGIWKNIVWTKNGTNFKMYVNGILDREVTLNGDVSGLMRTIGTLWGPCNSNNGDPGTVAYGPGTDSYGSVFSGLMGPLIVYSRTLAAAEVTSLYNNFRTRFSLDTIVTTGLVLQLNAYDRASYPGTGTTWTDLSGNGNTGTLTNGPTFDTGRGGSIVFDGSNDYVVAGAWSVSYLTVSTWVFRTSSTTNQGICRKENGWAVSQYNGTLQVAPGTSWQFYNTSYTIPLNTWVNIVYTYNGTGGSDSQVVYINGVSIFNTSAGTGAITSNGNAVRIGYDDNGWYWGGRIAQTHIYNRALSAGEVLKNFNAERWRFGI